MSAERAATCARDRARQHDDAAQAELVVHARPAARGVHGRSPARESAADRDRGLVEVPRRAQGPIARIEGGRPLPPDLRGAVMALGNFDGFHVGHQAVVGRAVAMARDRGAAVIVATFDPHPARHFAPDAAPFRLTTLAQRQGLFAAAGVAAMMVFRFDGALAHVTPEDFVRHWLVGAGGVVTGSDFRFGRARAGTGDVLARLARRQGMEYDAVGAVVRDNAAVSSSRIRAALRDGDCETAERLLTRPFAMSGRLSGGASCGGRGDPAVTVAGLDDYVRPPAGAYAARLRLSDGRSLRCVAHVDPSRAGGMRSGVLGLEVPGPTDAEDGQAVEVDLLGRLPAGQAHVGSVPLRDEQIVGVLNAGRDRW